MDKIIYRYSGRIFSNSEISWIQQLIITEPKLNRAQLSRRICEHLNWRKLDGGWKEVRCRVVLLEMEKDGLIKLPSPLTRPPAFSKKTIEYTQRTESGTLIESPAHELGVLQLIPVIDRKAASLWNEYIDRYHYLGHKTLAGNQMRYIVKADDKLIALLGFSSAAWKTAPRDRFICWDNQAREKNLHLVVNNARFLILPWVRSKNLASKILALAAKQLPHDWYKRYAYKPVLLETFVEVPRFTGGCYKAANWKLVGRTQGRGKWDVKNQATLPLKDIWLYPLRPDFKQILCV